MEENFSKPLYFSIKLDRIGGAVKVIGDCCVIKMLKFHSFS